MTDQSAPDGSRNEIALERVRVFQGPNPYAQEPVVVAQLRLGDDIEVSATATMEKLRAAFGDLLLPEPGEDREALARFAVQFAHAALSASTLDFGPVGTVQQEPGMFDLFIGFFDETASQRSLTLAARALELASSGDPLPADLAEQVRRVGRLGAALHPNIQGHVIRAAAAHRDVPVVPAWNIPGIRQYGWGKASELIQSASTNRNGYIGANIIADKIQSKHAISHLGLPTPRYAMVEAKSELAEAVNKVGFPCVIKPPNLHGGKAVFAGITSFGQAERAFELVRAQSSRPVLVEAFVQGDDHRLLVTGYELRTAMRKAKPAVTGDGNRTIDELTAELNASSDRVPINRLGAVGTATVPIGEGYILHLATQGLTPQSIPAEGQVVTLQGTSNQSTGGSLENVIDIIHPHVRTAAESMARTLQAQVVGFDYMTTDISKDWTEVPGNFIEMNLSPGLGHLVRGGMTEAEAGMQVLGKDTARIPLQVAIVPEAMLEQAQAHFAGLVPGRPAGIATHANAWFDRLVLDVRPGKPWAGVLTLLCNRALESAIVLAPSRHVQRHGLPVDRADRIWLCDEDFPEDWLPVLERTTRTDVRRVDLDALKRELRFDDEVDS